MNAKTHPQKPETAHTPGEWFRVERRYDGQDRAAIEICTFDNSGRPAQNIARINDCDINPKEEHTATVVANARLIASAPELLAVLKDIVRHHPEQMFHVAACSAIARAEGRAT